MNTQLLNINHQIAKFSGNEYLTLTGWPLCLPGLHLGDSRMAFTATLSIIGCNPLTTVTLLREYMLKQPKQDNTDPLFQTSSSI